MAQASSAPDLPVGAFWAPVQEVGFVAAGSHTFGWSHIDGYTVVIVGLDLVYDPSIDIASVQVRRAGSAIPFYSWTPGGADDASDAWRGALVVPTGDGIEANVLYIDGSLYVNATAYYVRQPQNY